MQESSVLSLIFEAQDPSFPVTSWIKKILTQLWTITVRQWIEAWSVRTESTASLCKTCIFKSLDTYWGVAVKCCYLFGHNRAYHGTVTALCFVSTPKAYILLICKATVNKTQKIQIKKITHKTRNKQLYWDVKIELLKIFKGRGKKTFFSLCRATDTNLQTHSTALFWTQQWLRLMHGSDRNHSNRRAPQQLQTHNDHHEYHKIHLPEMNARSWTNTQACLSHCRPRCETDLVFVETQQRLF